MCPHAWQASRSRSSPGMAPKTSGDPQREQKLSESAIHDGTPRPEGGRSSGRRGRARSRRRSREALTRPASRSPRRPRARRAPIEADGHPGEPEQALGRGRRHPRPGRAPDPQDRVGGRDDEERRGDQDAQLDQRAAGEVPSSSAVIAIVPADEHGDAEQDVVLLERGRGDLRDRPWRQALEARRERRGVRTACRSRTGMPGSQRSSSIAPRV